MCNRKMTLKFFSSLLILFLASPGSNGETTTEFWPGKDCPVDPDIGEIFVE